MLVVYEAKREAAWPSDGEYIIGRRNATDGTFG
jgi:hypothetical protein